jgi:hypothetical protein
MQRIAPCAGPVINEAIWTRRRESRIDRLRKSHGLRAGSAGHVAVDEPAHKLCELASRQFFRRGAFRFGVSKRGGKNSRRPAPMRPNSGKAFEGRENESRERRDRPVFLRPFRAPVTTSVNPRVRRSTPAANDPEFFPKDSSAGSASRQWARRATATRLRAGKGAPPPAARMSSRG